MTELGTRLKEARLQKGYSLEDLQEITKIQKRYLVGIEEGNWGINGFDFNIILKDKKTRLYSPVFFTIFSRI